MEYHVELQRRLEGPQAQGKQYNWARHAKRERSGQRIASHRRFKQIIIHFSDSASRYHYYLCSCRVCLDIILGRPFGLRLACERTAFDFILPHPALGFFIVRNNTLVSPFCFNQNISPEAYDPEWLRFTAYWFCLLHIWFRHPTTLYLAAQICRHSALLMVEAFCLRLLACYLELEQFVDRDSLPTRSSENPQT